MSPKKHILFIHQNFPGQYRYLVKHFAEHAQWEVSCVGEKPHLQRQLHLIPKNINILGYEMPRVAPAEVSSRLQHFASHVTRADALEKLLLRQKSKGLEPDVICVHPGWGEGLYLSEIFPEARLIYFFEFYFSTTKNNIHFDPLIASPYSKQVSYRMSNMANLMGLDTAHVGVSPTHWQWQTYPKEFQHKIRVIHDGVDTNVVKPTGAKSLALKNTSIGDVVLSEHDEIISYSVRNLEPSRGFHRYMRALPELQKRRPDAKFVIIGGDDVSYSGMHPSGKSWREVLLEEVGDQLDLSRTIFTGKVPYPALLDFFSITSLHIYITTPFVLSWSMMEAMACEAPLLASNTGPVVEVIKDGGNGCLFDYFSQEDLIEKVIKLMPDKALRKSLGKNARQYIVDHYDLNTVCLPQQLALIDEQLKH